MKTWSHVITRLANAHLPENPERQAYALIKEEHEHIKAQFDHCEQEVRSLEATYQSSKQRLLDLEKEAQVIEEDTRTAITQDQNDKAHSLATEIAHLRASVNANQVDVAKLENHIVSLKGVLSQNRFSLFRLEQQMDTLNATSQLQRAQHQLATKQGVRTALHSFAKLAAQPASNDAPLQAGTPMASTTTPETAESILARLKAPS